MTGQVSRVDLLQLGNPMGVPAESDLFLDPAGDCPPLWSETAVFAAWSPESGVGIWSHIGRRQGEPDLWWGQAITYLPDGRIAVDRSWGRQSEPHLASTGNLTIRVAEPHRRWSVHFDGGGEVMATSDLLGRLSGTGPQVPMRWEIDASAASPPWTLYQSTDGTKQEWAGDSHTQQTFRVQGRISVGSEGFDIDGVGYNDHSRGVRHFSAFGGDQWFVGLLPDRVIHLVDIYGRDGEYLMNHGGVFDADGHHVAHAHRLAGVDALGAPHRFELVADVDGRTEPMVLGGEVLHAAAVTVTRDNENLNGAGHDLPNDPMLFVESVVKLTTPDGLVGFANRETGMTLPAPAL